MEYTHFSSPVGPLTAFANQNNLTGLYFGRMNKNDAIALFKEAQFKKKPLNPILIQTQRQLELYFSGKLKKFSIPLQLDGTDFQVQAWKALLKIPYGKTVAYSEQAQTIGNPKAVRAIGSANGKNKISIIIPCHRVIGKNGSLAGFGGGLDKKKKLLDLEASF